MELKPLWREIPRLEHLKLTQTPKSIVTCRICRGQRIVAVESSVFHTYGSISISSISPSGIIFKNTMKVFKADQYSEAIL